MAEKVRELNNIFETKAKQYKRELIHTLVRPQRIVEFEADENAFQNIKATPKASADLPITLEKGGSIVLDFGDHFVGKLCFTADNAEGQRIIDSPIVLKFTFGEFPLEITVPAESYKGGLGSGWLQNETQSFAFAPFSGSVLRRFSFRYVKIERVDDSWRDICFTDIYADCTSAVSLEQAMKPQIEDETLKRIFDISLKTLKECEQDVFEDGPKRDRRLWMGDLRLQALTDYKTFRNLDLIKRCLYLFAAYRVDGKIVAPCVFPDSPPYIDSWYFADYSLFYISCLYDYMKNCDDMSLVEELYPVACDQLEYAVGNNVFVDWCPELDKSVAHIGIKLYTLRQFKEISQALSKDTAKADAQIETLEKSLRSFYSDEKGLFVTHSGQVSWHSQVWAVLSGALTLQESISLLEKTQSTKIEFTIHAPYMMHYYIEALVSCGLKEKAIEKIKQFWGDIVEKGFDCCPEIFNPENEFESPYDAPEINSACHAWSCTPAYWLTIL